MFDFIFYINGLSVVEFRITSQTQTLSLFPMSYLIVDNFLFSFFNFVIGFSC